MTCPISGVHYILQGQPPSPAADLYAVGVLAYELLAGRHPYDHDSLPKLIEHILYTHPDLQPLVDLGSDWQVNTLLLPRDFTPLTDNIAPDMPNSMPPDLAGIIGKLLNKDPRARYHNAESVSIDFSHTIGQAPEETLDIRESFLQAAAFVGRTAEMQRLVMALEKTHNNGRTAEGSAWLVGGESGVGKSRLLDELRIQALVKGVLVLRGQVNSNSGKPYELWRDLLRRLIIAMPISDFEASVLKEIVPDISTLLEREIIDAPLLDSVQNQQRLVQTIADLFLRQTQPVLLLLEDLQWAVESLAPLKHLLRVVDSLPLLIVGSFRHDEHPDLPSQLPEMQSMTLERLAHDDMATLSRSMLGIDGGRPAVLKLIEKETEGNAFFIVEVVRALAQEAGRLSDVGKMTLPERVFAKGIQTVIERRLARVPVLYHSLLNRAAIAGRRIDVRVLTAASQQEESAFDRTQIETWLTSCVNAAVLEYQDGFWNFAHDKLREALLNQLNGEDTRRLHRQIALAIEQVYPEDPAYALALAEHWRVAGDENREFHYARLAAHREHSTGNFPVARRMAERALRVLPATHTPHEKIDLLTLLGYILRNQGEYTEAKQQFEASLPLALQTGDALLIAPVLLGLGTAQADLREFAAAEPYLEEAHQLARHLPDEENLATIVNMLGTVAFENQDWARAKRFYEDSLAICRRNNETRGIARGLNNIGNVLREMGDLEGTRRCYLESLELWRQLGVRNGIAIVLNNLGTLAEEQGDLQAAKQYYAESLQMGRLIGDRFNTTVGLINLATITTELREWSNARHAAKEAVALARLMGIELLVLYALGAYACTFLAEDKAEHAARWIGAILAHPDASAEDRYLMEFHAKIEAKLTPVAFQVALDAGRELTLNALFTEIAGGSSS